MCPHARGSDILLLLKCFAAVFHCVLVNHCQMCLGWERKIYCQGRSLITRYHSCPKTVTNRKYWRGKIWLFHLVTIWLNIWFNDIIILKSSHYPPDTSYRLCHSIFQISAHLCNRSEWLPSSIPTVSLLYLQASSTASSYSRTLRALWCPQCDEKRTKGLRLLGCDSRSTGCFQPHAATSCSTSAGWNDREGRPLLADLLLSSIASRYLSAWLCHQV